MVAIKQHGALIQLSSLKSLERRYCCVCVVDGDCGLALNHGRLVLRKSFFPQIFWRLNFSLYADECSRMIYMLQTAGYITRNQGSYKTSRTLPPHRVSQLTAIGTSAPTAVGYVNDPGYLLLITVIIVLALKAPIADKPVS